VTKEEYTQHGSEALGAALAAQLEGDGGRPYVIPVGGSNSLGCWGYLAATEEIQRQAADMGVTFNTIAMVGGWGLWQPLPARLRLCRLVPHHSHRLPAPSPPPPPGLDSSLCQIHVLCMCTNTWKPSSLFLLPRFPQACGSGGTTAGLALGAHLAALGAGVVAYGVCDTPDYFYDFIDGLYGGLGWTGRQKGGGQGRWGTRSSEEHSCPVRARLLVSPVRPVSRPLLAPCDPECMLPYSPDTSVLLRSWSSIARLPCCHSPQSLLSLPLLCPSCMAAAPPLLRRCGCAADAQGGAGARCGVCHQHRTGAGGGAGGV
jgi:hypothetical protein